LLLALSIASLAVIVERTWLLVVLRDDVARLAKQLSEALRKGTLDEAKRILDGSPAPAAAVALAGLMEADRGADAAEQAMTGAAALQRRRLERRLSFLGTLGNNAPFIGLFGTVIGIMEAFQKLGESTHAVPGGAAPAADIMGGIAEALVATAVGLAVAIPAVAAYNFLQRTIKGRMADADILGAAVLGHLKGHPVAETASIVALRPRREI
jgi:biopolymer transport protein ExbB